MRLLKEVTDVSSVSNKIRLSGMSSGLDTEGIVKGLLTPFQTRLDKQHQTTIKLGWTADAYRGVNTKIKNFRAKFMSVLSDTNMLSEKSYNSFKAEMLTTTSAVSVTASSAANAGSMTIDSITQLASAATVKSTNVFTGTAYKSDTKLADLELSNKITFNEEGKLSFTINGKPLSFTKDNTIGDVINGVNTAGAGVKMSYSSLTKGFTLQSTSMGSSSAINIENVAGNAFASDNSAFGIAQGNITGNDAVLSINNIEVRQSTNSFTIDGINYVLKDTAGTPVKFSVNRDVSSTVDKIKSFITGYNDLVDSLKTTVEEKQYRDYTPLTDDQKKDMSDDEVKLWEDKAKSGLLHNDSYISSLLTSLRSSFYTQVEGTGMSMSDIGLNTGIYTDGAKITIDEAKLTEALNKDPEKVSKMFTQDGDKFETSGLMVRISDSFLSYTKDTTSIALDTLDDRVTYSQEQEGALQDKMDSKEESLWQRFSKMESAMTKLNGMSSWLSGLFSSASS